MYILNFRIEIPSSGGNGGINAADMDFLSQNFATIGCVFNHRTFYANAQVLRAVFLCNEENVKFHLFLCSLQASDSVSGCVWQLGNESCWKEMNSEVIGMLQRYIICWRSSFAYLSSVCVQYIFHIQCSTSSTEAFKVGHTR